MADRDPQSDALRAQVESLLKENAQLLRRATDAEQALTALAQGEVDALTVDGLVTPLLLRTAQENLQRSELLLRRVFDGALDAMLLADDQGRYVDANSAACELFGLPREQLLGRSVAEFAAPDFDGAEIHRDFLLDGRMRGRFSLARSDGSRRVLDYSAVAHVAPGLNLSVMRDITDRIEAENGLRRSEALFRAIIERGGDAISLTRADGTTFYRSPSVARLLGWSPEELERRTWSDSVHPEDLSAFATQVASVLHGGGWDAAMEFRVKRSDGSFLWMQGTCASLLDDPDVGAIVGTFHDITQRKRFEQAMHEGELRYRRLIGDVPEPVLVHVENKIVYANAASAHALGLAGPGALIGRSILDFASPETRVQIEARMSRPLTRGESLELAEQTLVRPDDGREIFVEVKSVGIDFDGRAATLSIARDVTVRRAAERTAAQALLEADLGRGRLEAVLAALPVGVWISDATGRLIQTNPAAVRIWGGSAPLSEDPSQYGVYEAFWPSTGKPLAAEDWALARTLKTGATIVAEEVEIVRFNGTRGYVLNSTGPVLDEHGRMVGGVVVILDVSAAHEATRERERLIASLDFERRRLGSLLEKAPAFIAVVRGPDHVFELVNDAYCDLIGRREILGKPVLEVIPEIRGQGVLELLDSVKASRVPFVANGVPVSLARQPGGAMEQRYLNFVYQPVVEADGSVSGVFAHGVDVTDATLAQQRVQAQFHGVPVPTYVWRQVARGGQRKFVLTDFNAAALTISQGGIAAYEGESADSFFADTPEVLVEIERCLSEGVTLQREMDHTLKATHQKRRLLVTYAPAPPDMVIVHTEDITDRVKLERQLQQSQKMEAVGRLAGGVAHDFNNLLSVILSYASLGIEELRPGDPLRADLEEIQTAGRRATELTRQLLAFSRQQVLQPRVIQLDQIVAGMKSMLARLLGEDIELTLVPAEGVARVLADPGQVEQVVMNLAVNARDAMPEGGKLTISVTNVRVEAGYVGSEVDVTPGDYVMLAVSDTGVGMDATTRARIFEPFFTTKGVGKGTGLGLSTVFGIVQQSQGSVRVYSEPGMGSTFRIYLPVTERVASDSTVGPRVAALRGSETILLVEDEEKVRAVACAVLRRSGYHVLEAANGGEAVLIAEDCPGTIHLLLSDVVMPRMSGRKLAEHLAPRRPAMKVLFASGYTDDAIVRHGVLDANVAFLQKPFTPDQLLRKVREVLSGG